MIKKHRRALRLLTALFIAVSIVNSIIRGSSVTLAIMAASALYACWLNFKINEGKGEYE